MNIPRPLRASAPAKVHRVSLAQETLDVLRAYHVRPRQQLGQNFLIDREALESVVLAADLALSQQVLEIGAGIGTLTRALGDTGADVVGIELDSVLARIASERTAEYSNVRICEGNVLHSELSSLLDTGKDYCVVANIPYYITAPILRHFLESDAKPRAMVLMVQREVGERLAAGPGRMSALTVFAQAYAAVEVVRLVPPTSFMPPPEVASAIIRLRLHESPPVPMLELPYVFTVVKAGFSAKRKMLHNALDHGLPNASTVIDLALRGAGIERTRRAETLSLQEWRMLAAALRHDAPNVPKHARIESAATPSEMA